MNVGKMRRHLERNQDDYLIQWNARQPRPAVFPSFARLAAVAQELRSTSVRLGPAVTGSIEE